VLTRVWWVFLCVTSSDIYRVGVLRPEVGPMAIVGLAHGLVTKEGTSWHLLVLVYLDQIVEYYLLMKTKLYKQVHYTILIQLCLMAF